MDKIKKCLACIEFLQGIEKLCSSTGPNTSPSVQNISQQKHIPLSRKY